MQAMLERTADPTARTATAQVRASVDLTRVINARYLSREESERIAKLCREGRRGV